MGLGAATLTTPPPPAALKTHELPPTPLNLGVQVGENKEKNNFVTLVQWQHQAHKWPKFELLHLHARNLTVLSSIGHKWLLFQGF